MKKNISFRLKINKKNNCTVTLGFSFSDINWARLNKELKTKNKSKENSFKKNPNKTCDTLWPLKFE